jgi:hypothetical protein
MEKISGILKVPNPFPNLGEPGSHVNDTPCEQHSPCTWELVTDDGFVCQPFAPAWLSLGSSDINHQQPKRRFVLTARDFWNS